MGLITKFIERSENVDLNEGLYLVGALLVSIIVEHYLDEHGHSINNQTGSAFQKSVDAMVMKKAVKLTAATCKNYGHGQIWGVKHCSHRIHWYVY